MNHFNSKYAEIVKKKKKIENEENYTSTMCLIFQSFMHGYSAMSFQLDSY